MFGLPNNTLVRHGQGWRDRAGAQPGDRRRPARHQGQPHRAGGVHADGGRAHDGARRRRTPDGADVARPRRADGRLPRPRGLPGHRRDLRGRRRPVRPHLHRRDRGVRPRHGGADGRGRRRATGRRSTTSSATPSRPTSARGRPRSWPTCAGRPPPVRPVPDRRRAVDLTLAEAERDLVELCRDFAQREIALAGAAGVERGALPDGPAPRDGRARPARRTCSATPASPSARRRPWPS